ncbi:MAG: sodium:solute symporter family protein, partial [Alkalimonas sp.]|nr:sodium:solute symporter family protein [Alkalimonas sp.]
MSTTLFFGAFGVYVIALVALSSWLAKRQKSGDDFLLAGRTVSTRLTLGTTLATMIGTGTSMGAVGYAYTNSWAGMLYGVGGALGILLTAWLFAPVRRYGFMTMSEELSFYVGANSLIRFSSAILIFIASLGWLGAHLIGGALYLSWATGMDLDSAKILIAVAFTTYIVIGGYTAVVWTDSLMAIILFTGFVLMALVIVQQSGGADMLMQQVPQEHQGWQALTHIGVIPALSLAAVIAIGVMATPSFRQRIYSGRSVSTVRRSFCIAGILYLAFAALPAVIGIAARISEPELANHQFAFATMAVAALPALLALVVLIAGVSATLTSASSDAMAAVTVFIRDLVQQIHPTGLSQARIILLSRCALIAIAALALSMALLSDDLIHYITSLIATVMSGLCATALLGRFWPRFNSSGALAALCSAMLTSIVILLTPSWLAFWGNPSIPALSVAIAMG